MTDVSSTSNFHSAEVPIQFGESQKFVGIITLGSESLQLNQEQSKKISELGSRIIGLIKSKSQTPIKINLSSYENCSHELKELIQQIREIIKNNPQFSKAGDLILTMRPKAYALKRIESQAFTSLRESYVKGKNIGGLYIFQEK